MKDFFEYQGVVKISALTKGKNSLLLEQHNEGTFDLFRFLCLSLIRDVDHDYRPKYISLAKKAENVFELIQSTPAVAYSSYSEDVESKKARATFVASIPSYMIIDRSQVDLYLCLLDGTENKNVLAYIKVDNQLNDIPQGTVLNVEWILGFVNPEPAETPQEE